MSCEVGKGEVARILFENLDSLKEIYGSPVLLNKPEAMTIAGVVLMDLLDQELGKNMFPFVQFNSILNKWFIWKTTRDDRDPTVAKELIEKIIMSLQKAVRNR